MNLILERTACCAMMIRALPFPAAKAQGRRAAAQRQHPREPCPPALRSPQPLVPRCSLGMATEPGCGEADLGEQPSPYSAQVPARCLSTHRWMLGMSHSLLPSVQGCHNPLPALACSAHSMPFLFHPIFLPSPLPFLTADLQLPPFLQLYPLIPLLLSLFSSGVVPPSPGCPALTSTLCQFYGTHVHFAVLPHTRSQNLTSLIRISINQPHLGSTQLADFPGATLVPKYRNT